ncbi:MAG: thioredoxin [Ruminococcaceae bacterium]|nr:thioredoxin [Oscillospiraceae bacterium]
MTERKKNLIAFSIAFVGIAFMAVGFYRGEAEDVLRKAIVICLECIGVG